MKATVLTSETQIKEEFPKIRHLFDKCVKRAVKGEFCSDDLMRLACEGKMFIGVVYDNNAPIFTAALEIIEYPRISVLNIVAIAGKRLDSIINQFWPEVLKFARSIGAHCIQASCHGGMARILKKYGFNEIYTVVRSDL